MGNDADDGYVKIGAFIDPTGANAGADQVVQDVDRIEDSTGSAAEGATKLTENLGGIRTAHHALAAISEIARGGTEAIAGEAMAVRLLGEAFESLIPGGAILVALATVVSLGASMVARQQEHNDKLADGKSAEDDFAASATAAGDAAKTAVEAASEALKLYLEGQKQVIENEKARAEIEQNRIKDLEKRSEATTKLTLATLELQKQEELGSATSSSQRDAIEARYKAREASVTGAGADGKYALEKQALEAQRTADQQEQRTRQTQVDDDQGKLDGLRAKAADTAQRAQAWGDVQPDATGSYEGAEKSQEKIFEQAGVEYNKAQDANAPIDQLTALQNNLTTQSTKLADITAAQAAQEKLKAGITDLQPKIDENNAALLKLAGSLDSLASQMQTAEANYSADKQKEVAQQQKDDEKAEQQTRDNQAAERKAQRDDDQQTAQNQLDLMGPDDLGRYALQLQIAQSKADQLMDEKFGKIYAGLIEAGSPQAKLYDDQAAGLVNKVKGAETNKENQKQIEYYKSEIEGNSNPLAKDELKRLLEQHLDPTKQIAELMKIVQDNQLVPLIQLVTLLNAKTAENTAAINRLHHP